MVSSPDPRHGGVPLNAPATNRAELARLLQRLDDAPDDGELRARTAELAVKVALREGDPSTADVAEALLADLPETSEPHVVERLELAAATARAARRAIVLARSAAKPSPADLADSVTAAPDALADQIEAKLSSGDRGLAIALLEVGLSRHPTARKLRRIQKGLHG